MDEYLETARATFNAEKIAEEAEFGVLGYEPFKEQDGEEYLSHFRGVLSAFHRYGASAVDAGLATVLSWGLPPGYSRPKDGDWETWVAEMVDEIHSGVWTWYRDSQTKGE